MEALTIGLLFGIFTFLYGRYRYNRGWSNATTFQLAKHMKPIPELETHQISDTQTLTDVHTAETCTPPCPIHAPTAHHMRDWQLFWREDRRIFERICLHGQGHPDPDNMAHILRTRGATEHMAESMHGCDGCCTPPKEVKA